MEHAILIISTLLALSCCESVEIDMDTDTETDTGTETDTMAETDSDSAALPTKADPPKTAWEKMPH